MEEESRAGNPSLIMKAQTCSSFEENKKLPVVAAIGLNLQQLVSKGK